MGRQKHADSTPTSPHNCAAKRSRVRTSHSATVNPSAAVTEDAIVPICNAVPSVVFVSPVAIVPFVATVTSLGAVHSSDAVFASSAIPAFIAVPNFIAGSLHPVAAMPPSDAVHPLAAVPPVANFIAEEGNLWINNRYKKPTVEEFHMFEEVINSEDDEFNILGEIDFVPVTKNLLQSLVGTNLLNSNVISCYLSLLDRGRVPFKFLDCSFMSFIKQKENRSAKSFAKHFKIKNVESVFCAFEIGLHFILINVNLKNKVLLNIFFFYDFLNYFYVIVILIYRKSTYTIVEIILWLT